MSKRECGTCALCCKLLPVPALHKRANDWCKHCKPGSAAPCTVYHGPEKPGECAVWSCRWLMGDCPPDILRPDKAHYVLDGAVDYITETDKRTGEVITRMCMQVWVDPGYPHAHRDPALRKTMEMVAGQRGMPTIVRWGAVKSMVVFPPPLGKWNEVHCNPDPTIGNFSKLPPDQQAALLGS